VNRESSPSSSPAAAVRDPSTYRAAVTVNTHVTPPVEVAAEKPHIRPIYDHRPAISSIHIAHASRQGGQHADTQSNLRQINLHSLQNTPQFSLLI
jgi:hypothetical protein